MIVQTENLVAKLPDAVCQDFVAQCIKITKQFYLTQKLPIIVVRMDRMSGSWDVVGGFPAYVVAHTLGLREVEVDAG